MNVLNECRVCFETTDQNLMVSPCVCRGSMAYIHFQCLKNCIETSGQQKCGICGQNWLGIEFVKKRKSFIDFLKEEEFQKFDYYFALFAIITAILTLFIHYKLGSPNLYYVWITLPFYGLYLLTFLQNIMGICILYKVIIDYQIWLKFNLKLYVIESKTNE